MHHIFLFFRNNLSSIPSIRENVAQDFGKLARGCDCTTKHHAPCKEPALSNVFQKKTCCIPYLSLILFNILSQCFFFIIIVFFGVWGVVVS